jgi:pimeloyl-ACP methyl ester carboxylesterase
MMMERPVLLTVFCALFCASCVPNKAYRIAYPAGKPPQVDPPKFEMPPPEDCGQNRGPGKPYTLAFIEFDDRGELFDRRQLTNAVQAIRDAKAAAAGMSPSAGQTPHASVFTFIHGWKNNASDNSGNVWGFRQTLACLASNYDPYPVVGIYIGWRGAVLSPPLLKEFTFYDRRNKSENIAGAHLVEALLGIMRAAKGERFEDDATISMLIGHSFGGAVLETALSQTIENTILDTPFDQAVRWPANLIVFVNEAAPAILSYQLIESMNANLWPRPACGGDFGPVILSISSTGDYATSAFFPLGQAVSRPFNSLRKYPPQSNVLGFSSQGPMFFNTTAHLTLFQSHLLGLASSPDIGNALGQCALGTHSGMVSNIQGSRYELVERPGARNLSPYWVAEMPTSIVPDHSTIFNRPFRSLLLDLVTSQPFHQGKYIRK